MSDKPCEASKTRPRHLSSPQHTARSMRVCLALLVASVAGFAPPAHRGAISGRTHTPCRSLLSMSTERDDQLDVWRFRENFVRGTYGMLISFKEDERYDSQKRTERREAGTSANSDASRSAFAASAAAVLVGALVLRLGGRAALVSVLGLDVVAELGIGDQIDQALQYADAVGNLKVVAFLAAWVVAKVFLVDFVSIALAFSSGILFGGVLEGALISAVGATIGSLTALGLSRTLLQERVQGAIEKQPVARALAKVVEEDGFKTVFVLRLSPILPIPTGAYPYIYGTSKLQPPTFALGYFLGSLKPYLLDSYLGVFSKQVIDGESLDGSRDIILLVGLGALVLVGVFATELATESWDLVNAEMKTETEERKAREAAGLLDDDEGPSPDAADDTWDGMVGPFNTTSFRQSVVELVPQEAREEASGVWSQMEAFCESQWQPAVREVLLKRREDEAKQARAEQMMSEVFETKNQTVLDALSQMVQDGNEDQGRVKAKGVGRLTLGAFRDAVGQG